MADVSEYANCINVEYSLKYITNNMRERLIDIVASNLEGLELNRNYKFYNIIGRYRVEQDNVDYCYWMYLNESKTKTPEVLKRVGLYVYRDSPLGVRIINGVLGNPFEFKAGRDVHRKPISHRATVFNASDFSNRCIKISEDPVTYTYDDLSDFLRKLKEKDAEIVENERRQRELEQEKQRLAAEAATAAKRGQIQKEINKLKESHLELTLQQEEMKNLTRFIREQGKLRFNPILDSVQNSIKTDYLYDGRVLIIDGGPGTGKTTTMIQRLKYLTDLYAIDMDADQDIPSFKLTIEQRNLLGELIQTRKDWIFFSPSELLKDYLADAMNREGFADTNSRVFNWERYKNDIIRDVYGLIDPTNENSPFATCRNNSTTLIYQNSSAISDFRNYYLSELKNIAKSFPNIDKTQYSWGVLATNIQNKFQGIENYNLSSFIALFSNLEKMYSSDCKLLTRKCIDLISDTTYKLLGIINTDDSLKSQMDKVLANINLDEDNDSSANTEINDEEDLINEDEPGVDDATYKAVRTWLRRYSYKRIDNTIKLTKRQDILSEVLKNVVEDSELALSIRQIGELVLFDKYAKFTRGVVANMLTRIPNKYKAFRKEVLKSNQRGWNLSLLSEIIESKKGKQLHRQEQSLLLGFINTLVKNIIVRLPNDKISHKYVDAYHEVCRPIIGIDEATDFSNVDIYAMMTLSRTELSSVTLCGDVMQRLTDSGLNNWEELNVIIPKDKIVKAKLKTSYRQSTKLLDVAKAMYHDTIGEEPNYVAYMKSKKVPAPLMFASSNENEKVAWIEKRIREVYLAYGKRLPSIAIFMNDKNEISTFVQKLKDSDFIFDANINVVDGSQGNVLADGNQIRVYPIDVVKGMEFDVVFFHNIDNSLLSADLVKRYIYVGVSRAAFFLGVTLNSSNQDYCKYFMEGDWSSVV